jgi:hypothetical protein
MMQANMNYISPVRVSCSAEPAATREQSGATETILYGLEFGATNYRFLRGIGIKSVRDYITGDWTCWSLDLEDDTAQIIGKGDTFASAEEDFKNQLHASFQRLYRKRPFEMNQQEQKQWQRLFNVIDVYHYRTTTPIVVQEIGQISFGKISRPYRIKWLTGHNYIIEPNRVPDELMSMKPGQYIEANVKRHPLTHKELEIVSARPISFRLPNNKEAEKIWNNMPAADLPAGGWD